MAGTSYTRQSTIADGNLISASLFNSEYNQIVNAFAYNTTGTTGHTHDGSAGQGGAIAKIGDQDFKNKIVVSSTDNRIEFYSEVGGSPVEQVRIQDGAIVPVTDSDVDLGTTSVRFKDAFVDSVTITNNVVVGGTVDGRDVATDGTKLDGIEASATADQTDAEIRAAVEAATDSNVFTDADHTKLNAIEASADVTDTTSVTAAGALMDSEVTNLAQVKAFDSADYATAAQGTTADAALPKAGGALTGAVTTTSTFDGVDIAARDGVLTTTTTTANEALPKSGGAMTGAITTNSTFDGRDVATDGTKLDGIEAGADVTDTTNVVASLTAGANITIAADGTIASTAAGGGNETLAQTLVLGNTTSGTDLSVSSGDNIVMAASSTVDGRDVSVDGAKLDGIEASADVTDTANVTAAGALMDSEVTNLAQVKAFDSADYATAAQGTTADAALPTTGGAMTGAITTNSTFDGRDVATDGTKLDGIEASADVTDTTNVVASLTAGSNITIAGDGTISSTASGGNETLAQTLALGNTTGGTDLVVSTGDNITLPDGAKIKLGDEPNLEIYHSGAHSFIEDVGGGSLFIKGSTQLKLMNGSENAVLCQENGAVTLYHNNIAKVATSATGVSVTGTVVTDAITIAGAITEDAVTLLGFNTTINLATATNFVHDLTGNTTYTFSNPAATGNASAFTLKIIQGTTARTITWPASVDWAGGTAPTLSTANNAVDVFVFYTIDGGTTYYGFTAGQAMA